MAIVGNQLTAPENEWRRYDDNNPLISYEGNWIIGNDPATYNGTSHFIQNQNSPEDFIVKFSFRGTKLRIIATLRNNMVDNAFISIDGKIYSYTQFSEITTYQVVLFEKKSLNDGVHSVVIWTNKNQGVFDVDAIDIDESGELTAYNPVDEKGFLLRVTMLDSSEREYQLTEAEIDGFINWFNTHTSATASSYKLTKKIGIRSSEEYLVFNKIISFEVSKF